jgi:hypothetical protein
MIDSGLAFSKPVAVVIPVYRTDLSPYEWVSFRQCLRVLGQYPIVLVTPRHLNVDSLRTEHPRLERISFDDAYFQSVAGYNRLLVSEEFYEAFAAYEFILIHQLDAFVFRDELRAWCAKGYDYIGAPHVTHRLRRAGRGGDPRFQLRKVLLNGGFSLRNVEACRRFLWIFNRFYGTWKGNEDGLFSLHYPRLYLGSPFLNLPTWDAALPFAFEQHPALCYELTHRQLPLGCHAWERYDVGFWRPFFRESGYDI